jgi:transcription initiation factor IIF auxiliary subunit
MNILINFAENGGTKEITHDLHFQAPKYDVTHAVVRLVCEKSINGKGIHKTFSDISEITG